MIGLFLKRGGGLAIFFGLMAMVALYAGMGQGEQADEFSNAPVVEGRVTDLETSKRLQSGSTSINYYVTVTVPGGHHRESVDGKFFATLTRGQTLSVRKLDGNPPRYRIDVDRLQSSSIWAFGMAGLLLVTSIWLTKFAWRSGRREWRLRNHGVRTKAEVIKITNGMIAQLHLKYSDADGHEHQAICLHPGGKIRPGDPVHILYDQDDPTEVMPVTAPGSKT